ncbi:glycosyltransferase family 2 protein [Rhodococcus rhodochrous]|uniref:glycosyltransferase family A protein n=1 Tax=Rhodococcus rhodochrous TaxID=1829 RepID=UPI000D081997|nr:glycosyltransferase family A protein [Rhodococcus rhodochrous]AYA23882.1 glycosyltransferase family 2 protein [Rhodococcus rhodochrous]
MKLIVVTPIHNEKSNIGVLADQIQRSSRKPDLWIIVDDGSTDGGAQIIRDRQNLADTIVLERSNKGGLIGGSAFTAWQYGVDYALEQHPDFTHIMKLDADVNLPDQYLEAVLEQFERDPACGLVGGVLIGNRDREQTIHVPGPVKMYSRAGYEALKSVPRAVGFDVMDELAIKAAGLQVLVRKDLQFTVRRAIGASQGLVHGRRRNGVVCRWTGYWTPYFGLHALRYIFRKPYVIGSIAMTYGYFSADSGPYDHELRARHAEEQKEKLKKAVKSPKRWLRDTYGVTP